MKSQKSAKLLPKELGDNFLILKHFFTKSHYYCLVITKRFSVGCKLGIGCGRAGSETENVGYFLMLVDSEKYDYIKKLAYSKYASNQLLSVLAMELFEKRKKITVDEELGKRILEIKSSNNSFASCCGCMPCNSGKLKDLLAEKNKNEYLVKGLRLFMKYRLDKNYICIS